MLHILHKALWCINPLHIAISALLMHCCSLAHPAFAQFMAVCCWHTICSYTAACPIRPSTLSQRHAVVMGSTWGLLIPLTILMATLRHKKKGWWFQLHRALATLSLILVIIGAVLGRRLRITHPPVTVAGKCHKVMGYVALSFIVLQVCEQTSALPCILDHNSVTCA